MADAKTPEQIGKDKLAPATTEAAAPADAKTAVERFVWQPRDITITKPEKTPLGTPKHGAGRPCIPKPCTPLDSEHGLHTQASDERRAAL
jgi:hypothetical protein